MKDVAALWQGVAVRGCFLAEAVFLNHATERKNEIAESLKFHHIEKPLVLVINTIDRAFALLFWLWSNVCIRSRHGCDRHFFVDELKTMKKILFVLGLNLLALTGGAATRPDKIQSHESIRAAVSDFMAQEMQSGLDIESTIRGVDARLRLRQCTQPLHTFWPPGARQSGASSVTVACEDNKPWKIYVQVMLKRYQQVLVADHALVRGHHLAAEDVRLERREVTRLGQKYLEDISPFIGYELRQSIRSGAVVKAQMFRAQKMIKRGQTVTMVAGDRGFQVQMRGKALADGALGKRIRVKNLKSKRVVEGEVISKGVVRIGQ